jgi:hypothetical protein
MIVHEKMSMKNWRWTPGIGPWLADRHIGCANKYAFHSHNLGSLSASTESIQDSEVGRHITIVYSKFTRSDMQGLVSLLPDFFTAKITSQSDGRLAVINRISKAQPPINCQGRSAATAEQGAYLRIPANHTHNELSAHCRSRVVT